MIFYRYFSFFYQNLFYFIKTFYQNLITALRFILDYNCVFLLLYKNQSCYSFSLVSLYFYLSMSYFVESCSISLHFKFCRNSSYSFLETVLWSRFTSTNSCMHRTSSFPQRDAIRLREVWLQLFQQEIECRVGISKICWLCQLKF